MVKVEIGSLKRAEIGKAASLASKAFIETPLCKAALGGTSPKHLKRLQMGLKKQISLKVGELLAAREGEELVGVLRMVTSPDCQKKALSTFAVPFAFLSIGTAALRLYEWRKVWGKHDPGQPHFHIDPLTVMPDKQGRGIGSALLTHFCEHVDTCEMHAYLETDQQRNVRLYERFGFEVQDTDMVLGVKNWFMWRKAR